MTALASEQTTHAKVEFNQALVDQWTPLIHKMIKKTVFGYDSSDVCYDYDDMFQMGLMALHEATLRYEGDKGTKFGTYLQTVLYCRIGSFRNKITGSRESGASKNFRTDNFTSIPGGWKTIGMGDDGEDSHGSRAFRDAVVQSSSSISEQLLDCKIVYDRLTGDRKAIYADYYIRGKGLKEIREDYPHLKYHQIRRVLKYLEQIHTTLVEGEVC